ncbi:MAG: ABC transporter ATP-binding protein [Rubricoccaceae bacterium]|nr:ABC transporter ATP-binding protein [Rubricoccaceae bacterium]
MKTDPAISLVDVSKFYGEVLGVNNVNLTIPAGITSLVGPNGSGKTTLMNLITGLLRPSSGQVYLHGLSPRKPEQFCRHVGYCTQFDTFPKGFTGYDFVFSLLRMHGLGTSETRSMAWESIERVGLADSARRRIASYSKGMRQRIKLAAAIGHNPPVLVLDEPLNGLDPMARAEFIALFERHAGEGKHVIVSSHILHEVDMISDQIVMMSHGYVVAEGEIQGVRTEMEEHPLSVLVRCDRPLVLCERLFGEGRVVEARISDDGGGVLVRTRNVDDFYGLLNRIVVAGEVDVDSVTPTDEDARSVYNYLIGANGQPL